MKKLAHILIPAGIIAGILNMLWLGYNTVKYLNVPVWFDSPEIYAMLIFYGLLVLFFSHMLIILSVVLTLKKESGAFISGLVLLILGSVSFIAMFFHWGALTDILKEFPAGLEINNELKAVWIAHILHVSFIIYALIYLIRIRWLQNVNVRSSSLIGEQLFVSLSITGIVCGLTGLLIVAVDFYFRNNPRSYKWAIIPYSLFVLIPYLLILSGWFFQAMNDRKSGWYDEKQKTDIYKSSTFTLLLSVPAMLLLFVFNFNSINGIVSILWLPFYLFIILLLFSAASLYNFKSY